MVVPVRGTPVTMMGRVIGSSAISGLRAWSLRVRSRVSRRSVISCCTPTQPVRVRLSMSA